MDRSPKVGGYCNQCGRCCKELIIVNRTTPIKTLKEFKKLTFFKPSYKIFKPMNEQFSDGFLRFKCQFIGNDNLCQHYENRPKMCRSFPTSAMFKYGAELPEGCSYTLLPEKEFSTVLNEIMKGKETRPSK
ncbi:MAG: YkgJ family cysteine cluster protein [Methylococcales bacterium]|nr:YkgJ family cysteine cluster protein [Methylococcales bacterium]MBT7410639.1 YkgJ family cysteine cluster protein [Methylococcales bacterium]